MAHAYYLAGDSYPKDLAVETALSDRLRRAGIEVTSHAELLEGLGLDHLPSGISTRVELVRRTLAQANRDELPFLLGRSSGARIATLVARRQPVAGVVCLGYPFRFPGRVIEPARFAHLARLKTPTLIFQGENDPYGGRGLRQDYALSPSVSLQFVAAAHHFKFGEKGWDKIAATVLRFMRVMAMRGEATRGRADPSSARKIGGLAADV